ncbi:acyltransferase [Undibacterium sp. 5I1]|uniref:acyltransferase family protein n=1 Tax=unclassified Undibacterium TaxID=2630295 RepID=UPI002AB39C66|nr:MULTISPECIES: acyltransferase [unclassified Undibacterium]MDY7538939.1 acyltransferase [Undibacterium sp. 5I1]MEB0232213.1 acyltransferase [Undibacterium sp. 10I3]MEB0259740.1 acyltransferase [Undibacterium sp. 5I1]
MTNRAIWVDYAKAIGILLVVYGHVARGVWNAGIPFDQATYSLIDSVIYSFHMPLFFFLSGLFFNASFQKYGAKNLLIGKLETIAYPYVVWSLLQGMVEVFLSKYTNGKVSIAEVLALFWMPRAHFWFLYVLFLVFILATLLHRFLQLNVASSKLRPLALVLLITSALYVGNGNGNMVAPFPIDYLMAYFVFFVLGIQSEQLAEVITTRPLLWLTTSTCAFVAAQWGFHQGLGLTYLQQGLLSLLLAVISIVFICSIAVFLAQLSQPTARAGLPPSLALLSFIGSCSMTIYLMHVLVASGLRIVLSKLLGVSNLAVHLLLGCLAGVAIPILIDRLSKRSAFSSLAYLFYPPRRLSLKPGSENKPG